MTAEYFMNHLFDLLNESDLPDVQKLWQIAPDTLRLITADGSSFDVRVQPNTEKTPGIF